MFLLGELPTVEIEASDPVIQNTSPWRETAVLRRYQRVGRADARKVLLLCGLMRCSLT